MQQYFLQPWLLLLLVPVMVLAVVFVFCYRRPMDSVAVKPGLPSNIIPRSREWRYIIAATLVGVVMAVSGFMLAQPSFVNDSGNKRATAMIVFDDSLSMKAEDIKPSRHAAAQAAIVSATKPADLNIGLVAFAGDAELVMAPSTDRSNLEKAVISLKPLPGGTATGEAIFTAVNSLDSLQSFGGSDDAFAGRIILISDGREEIREGQRNLKSAVKAAEESGYQIYTIAFGTADGEINGQPISVDTASLQYAASATGGLFYEAEDGAALESALSDIQSNSIVASSNKTINFAWMIVYGVTLAIFVTLCFITKRR